MSDFDERGPLGDEPAEGLGDLNAADLVDLLRDDPSGVDEVEAAENAREGGPRKTVLAAIDKARDEHGQPGLATAAPPAGEVEEPDTDDVSELDETQEEPDAQQEAQENAVEDADEDAAQDADEAPEDAAQDAVTFVCDQWAGVSLHGKGIKFHDHRYSTSDPRKIAVLDAWEHARRET